MTNVIISDTSCLIALNRINKLEILQQLFPIIITTPEVEQEFGESLPSWIGIQSVRNIAKKNEFTNLVDLGEASAIALAIETDYSILIIDEKKVRLLAKTLNVSIIGTVKILLLAKQRGFIKAIKPIVEELDGNKFRFSKSLVIKVLLEAKEN